MELTAGEIAAIAGGTVVAGDPRARARDFTIDSRSAHEHTCFVAVVAARDGHDFVADAWSRRATVALVGRPVGDAPAGAAVVLVDDPLGALAQLASQARDRSGAALVVGITGSAGKTATKDLVAAALGTTLRVQASPGSFNNEAGLPLTLLAAPPDVEAFVLEMGARAVGDIRALCAIARPTVGVITNVGLAHVGRFGDRETIARAKGELLEALDEGGLAVLRADDDAEFAMRARTAARTVLVSVGEAGDPRGDVHASGATLDADLRPSFRLDTPWGSGTVHLGVRGEHQIANAALAATVALANGVPFDAVREALAAVGSAAWRMEITRTGGVVVINDAYNANPASVAAALDALVRLADVDRRVAVLGDMRELGAHSAAQHAAIGDLVASLPVDVVVAVGEEVGPLAEHARAGGAEVVTVADAAAAASALRARVRTGDAVLVKGSRALGLEDVASALGAVAVERTS